MMVISPARPDDRIALRANVFGQVLSAVGTSDYAKACLALFEQSLDAEHWALFRYRADSSVSCIATASRMHMVAALENIDRFIVRCHRVDPSLIALKQRQSEDPCVTKMEIGDIRDRQYRHCFELTRVRERLGFFSRLDSDLHQLCVYRGTRRTFSDSEVAQFSALAGLVLLTAAKHERIRRDTSPFHRHLDSASIEQCLECLPGGLSKREREVCARAAAGKTIESTALELNIRRTSVITYRQRAYQKLGISRQNELVALVNDLRPDRIRTDRAALC